MHSLPAESYVWILTIPRVSWFDRVATRPSLLQQCYGRKRSNSPLLASGIHSLLHWPDVGRSSSVSIDRKSENATPPDEILIVILATVRGERNIIPSAHVRRATDVKLRSLNNWWALSVQYGHGGAASQLRKLLRLLPSLSRAYSLPLNFFLSSSASELIRDNW